MRKSEEVKHRLVIRQQELSTGSITDEVIDSMDIIDTAEEVYAQFMDNEEDGSTRVLSCGLGLIPMKDTMPYLLCLGIHALFLIDVAFNVWLLIGWE